MAKLGIEIEIRKMLKPSAPTPNHLRILNLSLFDQLSLPGVEYVETKVNADLAEFLHQGPNNEPLVDFLPKMEHRPSSPLIGVQVNVFNYGGLVMRIQISHIVANAFTLATFVNEWAYTSLTGTTKDCLSNFGHLSSLFPTRVLSGSQYSPPPPNTTTRPKIVTRGKYNTGRDTCVAIGKASSVDDVSSLVVNNHTKGVDKYLQRDTMDVYPITSWCGFPWYEADFGWRKPFWVTSVSINDYEAIVMMDTKDGDGIQAWIGLNENDMTQFERDPHILSSI
ncbi:hypothetical protein KY285_002930 [Solanum tuberosum]|nr:hypothetical protein KY285_002930 [Solanum tuberosum]